MSNSKKSKPDDGADVQYLRHLLHDSRPPLADHVTLDSDRAADHVSDETYLKIWEIDQANTSTRWTVTTFFFSVSFAIFGFSFQAQLAYPLPTIARISGLIIYWFAYLIFRRFYANSNVLRVYLGELEDSGRTQLDIQRRTHQILRAGRRRQLSVTNLLLYFGILYTFGIGILWWFRL